MRITNSILLATMNRHKVEEFGSLITGYPGVELVPAHPTIRNADRLGFGEKYQTYLENALTKARLANTASHYPTLADDSGLEVEALGGKPGVHSQRFAKAKPGQTQDQANLEALLQQLPPSGSLKARFVCVLALVVEGIHLHSTGILDGELIRTPRGANGFGYDPIFIPTGHSKTLAEMTSAEKNAISHRARALHDMMEQIKGHGITLAKP